MRSYTPRRLPTDEATLRKRIGGFGLDIVIFSEAPDRPRLFRVLLCREQTYAACDVHLALDVVSVPSDWAGWPSSGCLSGALTRSGLYEVLQWTDRATALARYQGMLRELPPEGAKPVLRLCE